MSKALLAGGRPARPVLLYGLSTRSNFESQKAVGKDPRLYNDALFKPDGLFEHEKGHPLSSSLWWNEGTIRSEYFLEAEFVAEQTSFALNPVVVHQLHFSLSVPELGLPARRPLLSAPPIRFKRKSRPSTPEPSLERRDPLVTSAPNEEVRKESIEKFDLFNQRYSKPGLQITENTLLVGFKVSNIVPLTFKAYGVAVNYDIRYNLLLECAGKESEHEVAMSDITIEPVTRPGGHLGPPEEPLLLDGSGESVVLEEMMLFGRVSTSLIAHPQSHTQKTPQNHHQPPYLVPMSANPGLYVCPCGMNNGVWLVVGASKCSMCSWSWGMYEAARRASEQRQQRLEEREHLRSAREEEDGDGRG
ncbi:hypothetical protein EJ02DRAFT_512454 [Clathrospora elynae]|uniref:Uncharacterized protein n=1 Tax=Clathrospora elynae TaxID=706981 RepID=A0A6A5SNW6_9PLEO|nr:hypothetical protein EJ02DRAFT_512454 [Clathrospora elynae]